MQTLQLQRLLRSIAEGQARVGDTKTPPGVVLEAAIDQVPPEERHVLVLLLFGGHRPADIARALGYTMSEVEELHESALHHVRRYLRATAIAVSAQLRRR